MCIRDLSVYANEPRDEKKEQFTALLHHVDVDLLRAAFSWLKRDAAPGVDGLTWQSTGRTSKPTWWICMRAFTVAPIGRCPDVVSSSESGWTRAAVGIAALEDKIVQRAVVEVLNAVYEEDFQGFSYGLWPGRSQHDALDALAVGITQTKVNWILDVEARLHFDDAGVEGKKYQRKGIEYVGTHERCMPCLRLDPRSTESSPA